MSGASRGIPPIGATASANAYKPRCADEELIYHVVAAELDGFLAEAEARGHPLPSFVESTFRDFLTCGIPEHGFLRVHCDGCGRDRVVPFSCKRRGVCNSCAGRRMAETAAHLVDGVLPTVPTRQWVLSLPFPMRYRLAYDRDLATPLLAAFLRAVFASLRIRGDGHERVVERRDRPGLRSGRRCLQRGNGRRHAVRNRAVQGQSESDSLRESGSAADRGQRPFATCDPGHLKRCFLTTARGPWSSDNGPLVDSALPP